MMANIVLKDGYVCALYHFFCEFYSQKMIPKGYNGILPCQGLADAVLEVACLFGGEGAVDEDGEGELVTVGGSDIAAEGNDAFEGSRLGMHVAIGGT